MGGVSKQNPRSNAAAGCGLCRMILLQDPNPDPQRQMSGINLFGGAAKVEAPGWELGFSSWEDVDSLYFSTLPEQFSLLLSVSAASSKLNCIFRQFKLTSDYRQPGFKVRVAETNRKDFGNQRAHQSSPKLVERLS